MRYERWKIGGHRWVLKITAKQIAITLWFCFGLLLIAAWFFGAGGEICKEDKSGQEYCTVYGLAEFTIIKIGKFLDDVSVVMTAFATIFIALFTWTLWKSSDELGSIAEKQMLISGAQVDIQLKQHAIARLQFTANNRPRLRIRNIVVTPHSSAGRVFAGRYLSVAGYVENIGGTAATISSSHIEIYANQMGLPMESPYEGMQPNTILEGSFNVGESRRFLLTQLSPLATEGEADRAFAGEFPIFVLGWITYSDQTEQATLHGTAYRLAFCRRWEIGKRRFTPIKDDPDYEYEG